jgi:hypothetical protein
MLRFTGSPHNEPIVVNVAYRAVYDEQLTLALADAIGVLTRAIGIARGQDVSDEQEALRWMKEFLIGFALLAVGEARSIILLLGDGLSRHARVHVRSLFEYELRVKFLTANPTRALAFRDSLAFEMRSVGRELGASRETVEREIGETLGVADPSKVVGTKESDALGGSVRNQMRNEVWPQKRYFGSFAGMSWISHGSVLALREISRAVESAASDLLHRAADDGNGNDWLHHAGWIILKLAGSIQEHFKFRLQGVEEVAARLIAANERLGVISKEQERAAADALAAAGKREEA